MRKPSSIILTSCLTIVAATTTLLSAAEAEKAEKPDNGSAAWRENAAEYARILSRVEWTPVAEGMPMRGKGYFKKGVAYTGVPYSSVKSLGRYIGFDIFLKTFLAAVENPRSVLYTEDLSGKVSNAGGYYGAVCSSYTSYALKCGIWFCEPPPRPGLSRGRSPGRTAVGAGRRCGRRHLYPARVAGRRLAHRDRDGSNQRRRRDGDACPEGRQLAADNANHQADRQEVQCIHLSEGPAALPNHGPGRVARAKPGRIVPVPQLRRGLRDPRPSTASCFSTAAIGCRISKTRP